MKEQFKMALFKTDYSNINQNDYSALPTGEYEMVINKASENATPNGAETFQVDLVVRNDLSNVAELAETNGKYKNRHVFNDNWKRKSGKFQGQYQLDDLQHILMAAKVPEGTEINSMKEFADAITGKPVRVYVKKQFSEYRGEDENQVAPWNYSETQFPVLNHKFDKKQPTSDDTIQIPDDDMPF